MLQTILSISGKPGLYKLVSRGNNNLIVEVLDETKKRQPIFATDRVTSLADIAIFTESEDMPLGEVLAKVRDKEEGKECSLNWRKAHQKSFNVILQKCFLLSIATECIIVILKSYYNGMTFL